MGDRECLRQGSNICSRSEAWSQEGLDKFRLDKYLVKPLYVLPQTMWSDLLRYECALGREEQNDLQQN
jgi:hypothetical protein